MDAERRPLVSRLAPVHFSSARDQLLLQTSRRYPTPSKTQFLHETLHKGNLGHWSRLTASIGATPTVVSAQGVAY